ncbi:Uncharacterized protein BM_BM8984 [Brugia malayi]|uniref:Bm8984, isoform a n=1 Tax=Brugia malayi TaxID=6279 RepID=A0A0K0JXP4_BRUMA|nr:Uncharacterized protein BM_BM8984 [Brugia malayi]CDQ05969.1 Bm8984, isoform b [Brugia malayi]VIO89729.1 Uncharacterized protein BM_BM8984 [Brugia malayi]
MSLAISKMTDSINYKKSSNLTTFGNDSSEIENTDEIIAFYDSRHVSNHMDDVLNTILIAISAVAIMTAFGIAMASALYRRRRKLCVSSKLYRHAKSSFFATETETHTWDSLSFSCSATDFPASKMQFHSLESLSDDSYINSLDEAISYKASIVHKKSLKNASPNSTTNKTVSELSVNVNNQ